MFKVVIKIGSAWVNASQDIPRSQARRLARFYREGYVSPNVATAKVVRTTR